MLYNVDFRLQMMERQVARAAGTRSDEETKQMNAKITKLTEVLDGVNAEHAMLTSQVKKAEEDLSESCDLVLTHTHTHAHRVYDRCTWQCSTRRFCSLLNHACLEQALLLCTSVRLTQVH